MIQYQMERRRWGMKRFCDISTRNELADFLKIPRGKLSYLLFVEGIDKQYQTFEIPKKHGGTRMICAPSEDLKGIQRRLAAALVSYHKTILDQRKPVVSHGFEKGRGIITNARVHRNKRFVLNLDLENFFPSFHGILSAVSGSCHGGTSASRVCGKPQENQASISRLAARGHRADRQQKASRQPGVL